MLFVLIAIAGVAVWFYNDYRENFKLASDYYESEAYTIAQYYAEQANEAKLPAYFKKETTEIIKNSEKKQKEELIANQKRNTNSRTDLINFNKEAEKTLVYTVIEVNKEKNLEEKKKIVETKIEEIRPFLKTIPNAEFRQLLNAFSQVIAEPEVYDNVRENEGVEVTKKVKEKMNTYYRMLEKYEKRYGVELYTSEKFFREN